MKIYPLRLFLIISFCTLYACSTFGPGAPREVWIDVRSTAEHEASSIAGHANIPHTGIGDKIAQLVPDKNTPVFLYCGSGVRAGLARQTLESMGYTHVTNAGSIEDVRNSKQPQP